MNSRVGRIALKLRLGEAERARATSLRDTVEHVLLQQALDELERVVHERLGPNAIVRARALSLRWQLDADLVEDASSALEMGRDLAGSLLATLEALPRPERLRPEPQRNVVVFADQDHAVAAYLADAAEGRTAWFHAPFTNATHTWATVVQQGSARADAVARWLERMECRERVLTWLAATASLHSAPPPPLQLVAPPANASDASPALPAIQALRADNVVRAAQPLHDATVASASAQEAELAVDRSGIAATRAAGIWYLARLVLELELAEQLWQVGVHEGDFLAHVVSAIAGPDLVDDPAWRWFGGAFDREPVLDAIADWADDELAAKLTTTLARLRLEAMPHLANALPCIVPAPDPRTSAVVSRSAAALVQLFCARFGCEPSVSRIRELLRVPGRLELGDPLRVVMPMEHIDIDVRRAGLDFDPGYVPWLQRKVVLEFEA